MKDRIKKFYKDHERDIQDSLIVGGSFAVVIGASFFYGYLNGKARVDVEGMWSGAGLYDDGETYNGFRVLLTNGREEFFFPTTVPEAA